MKKMLSAIIASLLLLTNVAFALDIDYTSLTDIELDEIIREAMTERSNRQSSQATVAIKPSPDKYTWYIQNYVGKNVGSFGYTSLGGDRLERYGNGYLKFIFIPEDGRYIDIEDENELREYVVVGQSYSPNTELKYVYSTDSEGNEYSNLVDYQSIDTIDLSIKRIDETLIGDKQTSELIPIQAAPDKYTYYIRNYTGKNLASVGYTSFGGERRDKYGHASVLLSIVCDDGSFVDPEDTENLKHYLIVSQDIAPNTEMKLTYMKDSKGAEYSNLIDTQSYDTLTLHVVKLNLAYPEKTTPEPKPTASTDSSTTTPKPVANVGIVQTYRDIEYQVMSDGNIEVCSIKNKNATSVTIPSEINGAAVTQIAEHAFEDCTSLKTVLNWAKLTSIGSFAFRNCSSLTDISIPSETTHIGEAAFENCSSLKTVIIWGNPTAIESNTFKGCSKLQSISLASSVTCIGDSAFEDCAKLKTVIIWGDIEFVGNNAFKNCKKLDSISIPSSCEKIGDSAFEGCSDLDSVILWGDTNIGNSAFRNCIGIESISISSGTDYIGDNAFQGCTDLENVIMWGHTTTIGKDAFADYPNLKRVPK